MRYRSAHAYAQVFLVSDEAPTYLLVDGENIDATLGVHPRRRAPPRAAAPLGARADFAQQTWDQPVKALFFLNASNGTLPMSFVQALMAHRLPADPAVGRAVREGRRHRHQAHPRRHRAAARATCCWPATTVTSPPSWRRSSTTGPAGRACSAFREFTSTELSALGAKGLETFDLEGDVAAFNVQLPRLRIIPLDEFDPLRYL